MVNESVSKNCLTILSVNTFWVPDVIIKRYDVDLVCGSAETATSPRAYSIVSMNGPLRLWDWWSVLNNRIAVSPRTVKSPVGIKIWSGTVLVHKTGHVFIQICIIRKEIENTTNFVFLQKYPFSRKTNYTLTLSQYWNFCSWKALRFARSQY